MQYEDCKPIESMMVTAWLIKFGNNDKHVAIFHKHATIEEVQGLFKKHFPDRKFTVMRIDVGEFLIHECHINQYYSGDSRHIDQDMNLGV